MTLIRPTILTFLFTLLLTSSIGAQEAPAEKSVEELAKSAGPSVVVIQHSNREGKEQGLGSGFILSEDGLIATNLHVIGEARPITVQMKDGKTYPVKEVYASDRTLDLALLKIDAKNLPVLKLGDSDKLKNGQAIVALGHPRGLKYSVVSGVLSGRPEVDGNTMLQLAIPIEAGNSGGPVLDRQGNVHGIVTLNSLVTYNLGFAMPVNALKRLIKKPNPIPMSRWVTIGTINPEEWRILFGGSWRQRSGKIAVDGSGQGFGGRTLCLSKADVPKVPFEVAVTVRLDDESGAAGLVFHADGKDKHYGFYPSNGQMRLSRFEGPSVFSWKVLHQKPNEHYKPGEWNTLKVRIEKDRILCFVNDELAVESTDNAMKSGQIGLCMFRNTHSEFKNFRVGSKLPSLQPPAEVIARINKTIDTINWKQKPDKKLLGKLSKTPADSMSVLRLKAKELEAQAEKLRELAKTVHHKNVLNKLAKIIERPDDKIDLFRAALLISKLDNEELQSDVYMRQIDRLAKELRDALPKDADESARLAHLNKELFTQRGFHGSRADYYNRANSYMDRVLDDREGIPITLSVLYMELARRLDLQMEGVGLPGHFIVRLVSKKGKGQLIDVYEGGKWMSRKDADTKVRNITGEPLEENHLATVDKKAILVRMLYNLFGIARRDKKLPDMIRYQDAILTIMPDLIEERVLRAANRFQNGDKQGALEDVDWLLDNNPPGINREKMLQLKEFLQKQR